MSQQLIQRMREGNRRYRAEADAERRLALARDGQKPYAIVVACSDSRVIPEEIFHAESGDLFVIRVAGNVLDRHQLGSIEYAAAHLGTPLIVVLGHTGCGAVAAALHGESDGFIRFITDEILEAIGETRDPGEACRRNVRHAMDRIEREFSVHPEIREPLIRGAVFDLESGEVSWLDGR